MDLNREQSSLLAKTQSWLIKHDIFALLVRSTDRYFNEYVPRHLSIRGKLTGFDGSVGDALITQNEAHLFIDGRYTLQASEQAQGFSVHVASNTQSIESLWLTKLATLLPSHSTLAYDPSTVDLSLFDKMSTQLEKNQVKLNDDFQAFVLDVLGPDGQKLSGEARAFIAPLELCGMTVLEKLKKIKALLGELCVDGMLVTKLDDIAWLTNIRSHYFPYQSALPGIAAVFFDRIIFGAGVNVGLHVDSAIKLVPEAQFFQAVSEHMNRAMRLGIDAAEVSKAHELSLHKHKIAVQRVKSPTALLKARKNEKELLHLRSAFKKADHAVLNTQNYVADCFEKNQSLNECDVDDYIKNAFKESGAKELSFRPICASGEHGAIIHYGHPSSEKILAENSLFLLDTGAYYEAGYATDLTRTFLAGKKSATAHPWQKHMFTLVLKASIRGLSARLRRGTIGMQLDAMVRAPLWQAGLDFAHGTGHGVGINVHEFPPRIGPTSTTELMEGQVFSIEPGLYFAGLGGVRIENLATIVADPDHEQFMRVLPLTFCPLDERLIDHTMLDAEDKAFLEYYRQEWSNDAPWPNLPPLTTMEFLTKRV